MAATTNETTSGTDSVSPGCRGVYLLTHPRTCSNLFMRMMSEQPGVKRSEYFFMPGSLAAQGVLPRGPLKDLPEDEREALFAKYQECYNNLEDELASVEKQGFSKGALIKEHVSMMLPPSSFFDFMYGDDGLPPLRLKSKLGFQTYTNPTMLPDELLLSMQPVFLIRNPIRMLASFARVREEIAFPGGAERITHDAFYSLQGPRALFDWYSAQENGPIPRILDADDLMKDRAILKKLCSDVGLDPDSVLYEWEERQDPDDAMMRTMLSTVNHSKGIVPGLDAEGLSIDEEAIKWRETFGEKDGNDLATMVRAAMPVYEYLYSRRFTAA